MYRILFSQLINLTPIFQVSMNFEFNACGENDFAVIGLAFYTNCSLVIYTSFLF